MKYKSSIKNLVNEERVNAAKVIFVGFVFILAFVLFAFCSLKVSALDEESGSTITILGTMYDKDGEDGVESDEENFSVVTLGSGSDVLTFIQGNGSGDQVAIKFTISNFPKDAVSFMIVESERSDSSSQADADRYSKELVTENGVPVIKWKASPNNKTPTGGIAGSASFTEAANGDISVDIVYRLRKGAYGMSFLKVFFYKESITTGGEVVDTIVPESDPFSSKTAFYVIAQPIDAVSQGATCSAKHETDICVQYDEDGATSRISKELKIYIPTTVAYNFKIVDIVTAPYGNNKVVDNYDQITGPNGASIYAISYFTENVSGDVYPADPGASDVKIYMYSNFELSGLDSNARTGVFYNATNDGNYTYFPNGSAENTFAANEVDYILTKVDSIGRYVYHIRDIFGNEKEIKQDVGNVKNRTIITEIKKGNATDKGYDAVETFQNTSVEISIKMTTETHFEIGICYDRKCSAIIDLSKDDVAVVRYWRVDIESILANNGNVDVDAYDPDSANTNYANEDYAYNGSKYIYCNSALAVSVNCSTVTIQEYNAANPTAEDSEGYSIFGKGENDKNVLYMFIGVNGRYRYYVEDRFGNNTWGTAGDLIQEEYRNPRVEVYAIDKSAPVVTFEHDATNTETGLRSFEIDTFEYYAGLDLAAGEMLTANTVTVNGVETTYYSYLYDGRVTGNAATEKYISEKIYYPINRDDGRDIDKEFTNADAIKLSKVVASEYVYYHNNGTSLFSSYSGASDSYTTTGYVNDISTILKSVRSNSNGLRLENNRFAFKNEEITYYHKDGNKLVCEQIGGDYADKNPLECVNYYLDHGVDFIIEFAATDSVGNVGKGRVYVDVVDTTTPGFTMHYKTDGDGNILTDGDGNKIIDTEKLIKGSNIGTDCRMEIGQEIGAGKNQTMLNILNCYKVDVSETINASNTYNFEDNVYDPSVNGGLNFKNLINNVSHVKLFMETDVIVDGEPVLADLSTETFIPNKTGYYDMTIIINDNAGNTLTILTSYYVDRKIVLVKPIENSKFYGDTEIGLDLHYCVYIYEDIGKNYEIRFSENPYQDDGVIFKEIYCTNDDRVAAGKVALFQQNENSDFYGLLSRLESSWYNKEKGKFADAQNTLGVENNYAGLYKIILGTLNINLNSDGTTQDDDYIVKVHPKFRNAAVRLDGNDNSINSANMFEDDDNMTESKVEFTIKQVVINVSAAGGGKFYGDKDTGFEYYNNNTANRYLNGVDLENVEGLKYNENAEDVILGVLRREVGENVGVYTICNYRGADSSLTDKTIEATNNMYANCRDMTSAGLTFGDDTTYTYVDGILVVNSDYVRSRALYVSTNKPGIAGKTLNTVDNAAVLRDNEHSNYVINFTQGQYTIESIDLVVQAAPGQRREYNHNQTTDPNPWEIILYGLKDVDVKRVAEIEGEVVGFNGYTASSQDYTTTVANDASAVALIEANKSETRTNWYLYHMDSNLNELVRLEGLKTNQSYSLLRSTDDNSDAGSGLLIREAGKAGGWYFYGSLANDLNIVSTASMGVVSKLAVNTNGRSQCNYDATGHLVTGVDGSTLCKNYNLIFNPYYTNSEGYTVKTKTASHVATNGIFEDFVYKSNGTSCITGDPYDTCYENNEADETNERYYKIMFEIYRRELILEFNSAIETVITSNEDPWHIRYGKRYNYYENKLFNYVSTGIKPEGYLFLCYQNKNNMTPADLDSGGCTSDPSYGLTAGDTWANIQLTFNMHTLVSDQNLSEFYDDEDNAIPAGVYYIYSDIKEEEKYNYKYDYLGGTITIKSLPAEIVITSYVKEYGEKYYTHYGLGENYQSFAEFDSSCLMDKEFLGTLTTLVDAECVAATDKENSEKNVFGFQITQLDYMDTIEDNFIGRPNRARNGSENDDEYGLQDNAGIHTLSKGTITTKNNNKFVANNSCTLEELETKTDCVLISGKELDNYIVEGETIVYTFNLVGEANPVNSKLDNDDLPIPASVKGRVFITPAELIIKVAANQTKMYGCAYNKFNVDATTVLNSYSYATGYDCVETDGDYYDLGYKYTVSGDKDYQIAKNGYGYTSNETYDVVGIAGAEFRPQIADYTGSKEHALNTGTLYRIPWSTYFNAGASETNGIKTSVYAEEASKAKTGSSKVYQAQTVGKYVITLGSLDATKNEAGGEIYKNSCDANNIPGIGDAYKFICKNYVIDYYGTSVYEVDKADAASINSEPAQKYVTESGNYPLELTFTITQRKAYLYTDYTQKIYGTADMYSNPAANEAIYFCGDYNMDGIVNDDDYTTIDGTKINLDVYYGFCSKEQVEENTDADADFSIINYGLTRYYTKYNSLAKAPWNGLLTRDDVQTDVVAGKISRKGMGTAAPNTNDNRGYYEYVYENGTFGGTVHLTDSYGVTNYDINYYNEDGLAVKEDGTTTTEYMGEAKDVKYEIVFRQIKIAFASFGKVYGEQDNVTNYNLLVCSPSETFDFDSMTCTNKVTGDKHGLSDYHKGVYLDGDGKLNQASFKDDFVVRFARTLGENVACTTSVGTTVEKNGYFFGAGADADGLTYAITLNCRTIEAENAAGESYEAKVYETLAYIDQNSGYPGFNYQVSYEIGYVEITPRPIVITPTPNQGFMYGNYHDTLIPAITYTDSVGEGTGIVATYGLVHGSGSQGLCLNNIDYYNKDLDDRSNFSKGTCFIVNDRVDEYAEGSNESTSSYDENAVSAATGLSSLDSKNYVFGDNYSLSSETGGNSRSALNRKIKNDIHGNSSDNARYNRNVGTYEITKGDLADKTGNYDVKVTEGVEYIISYVPVKVTPDRISLETTSTSGSSQEGQFKIYGEKDKELTFTVATTYTVSSNYYAKYNSNIFSVESDGEVKLLAELTRYNYSSTTKEFTSATDGAYIKLLKNDIVTLNGFAYNENGDTSNNLNYGISQTGLKSGTADATVVQGNTITEDIMYYDRVCKDADESIGCSNDSGRPKLTYGATSRILLGYLYVNGYAQAAGKYNIISGFQVAKNEWASENYYLSVDETVKFTIIPRPVAVQIVNVTKTYGQTTDVISCDDLTNCSSVESGILMSGNNYLRYNFTASTIGGSDPIISLIKKDGEYDNKNLYSQNGVYATGIAINSDYTEKGSADNKNTETLGVYVSRDEKNSSSADCLYDGDRYGFCEDVGSYSLRLYGYVNTIDSLTKDNYASIYRPSVTSYTELNSDVEEYYYDSYFGYNPNYFVVVMDGNGTAVTASNLFDEDYESTARSASASAKPYDKLLNATGSLTINKKDVALAVNTKFFEEGEEVYYVGQNTQAPNLPLIKNSYDLDYNKFHGIGVEENRRTAIGDVSTYKNIVWGTQPSQVRTGDKLGGELAYCNKIIAAGDYDQMWETGLVLGATDYTYSGCGDSYLIKNGEKHKVNTNLTGYIPIVRSISDLSIVNATTADNQANAAYEKNNYNVIFYPGALRIEEDDVKPVVEVNRGDVYIEANAVGTYSYDCVAQKGSTTYDCGNGISIVGKTELENRDPILNWLNTSANYDLIVKVDLPVLAGCGSDGECTTSEYLEKMYGKLKTGFTGIASDGIGRPWSSDFQLTMQKDGEIQNSGPSSIQELVNTLVSWFGVTTFDLGEVRDGQYLDKHFDKYWYIVIEKYGDTVYGTEEKKASEVHEYRNKSQDNDEDIEKASIFDISRVGTFKVHFYVMDNAGNVSEGNMYEDGELQTGHKNVGTLHIVDTTKPVVGTLNLYNGKVRCIDVNNTDALKDCSIENNWEVAEDTYIHISTLLRYNQDGTPYDGTGNVYVDVGDPQLRELSGVTRYSRDALTAGGYRYTEDSLGRYIKIAEGKNARALKHYAWSSSPNGIYMTITGGSDNSYTTNNLSGSTSDFSQWNHYYSRDGGITWHLYDRSVNGRTTDGNATYLALNAEGSREILIKAVDSGVKIVSTESKTATYVTSKYYDVKTNTIAKTDTATMTYYTFQDSTTTQVGWNLSDAAENDEDMADKISKLISGKEASENGDYKFIRDRQTAYLDRTNPVVSLIGEKLYVHEFGCATLCTVGYDEKFVSAIDSATNSSREIAATSILLDYSKFINNSIYSPGDANYQDNYDENTEETLTTKSTESSGLGSDSYIMNGTTGVATDIRNLYALDRVYVIYEFNQSGVRRVYDLSDLINDSSNITDIIGDPTTYSQDYTYTIIYYVFDKAGNESAYVSRGVVYVNLVPSITPAMNDEPIEPQGNNTYNLTIEQGTDLQEVINSLSINVGDKKQFLTQTIYYNGELVVDDKKYKENIYEGFTTAVPGVYEITYNLRYMYHSDDGRSELIEATPVKLTITIEETPPIVNNDKNMNYTNIVVLVSIVLAGLAICYFSLLLSRKKN